MSYPAKDLAAIVRSLRTDLVAKHRRQLSQGTRQSWENADELARLDAAIALLDWQARLTPLQQQFIALTMCVGPQHPALVLDNPSPLVQVPEAEPQPAGGAPVVYLRGDQHEEITRLLAHPLITKLERQQMLAKLSRFTEARAAKAIPRLLKGITERGGGAEVAKSDHPVLVGDDHQAAYEELNELLNDSTVTTEERRKVRLTLDTCNTQMLHLLQKTWRSRIDERRGSSYQVVGEAFPVGAARDHHAA